MPLDVKSIWFWQNMFSPHMSSLAVSLVERGCQVSIVAEEEVLEERARYGWTLPNLEGVKLRVVKSRHSVRTLASTAPLNSFHICSGLRANGLIGYAQKVLRTRGLKQLAILETVDDRGLRGSVKRLVYRVLFCQARRYIVGVLAIGHRMPGWVSSLGFPSNKVFPFAYFLPNVDFGKQLNLARSNAFTFAFVGRLIPIKRVEFLFRALASLESRDFDLIIVGSGPEENSLRNLAFLLLGERVRWLGLLPMADVPSVLQTVDCLVLPSIHDGWGAVVSEALMVGTPVVCSDACGSAEVVKRSGFGGVFACDNIDELISLLQKCVHLGVVSASSRNQLAEWSKCLSGTEGAEYLLRVIDSLGGSLKPRAPWELSL